MPSLTPQDFVAKWRSTALKERAAAQEHFIDLCHLIDHPTPADADPTGERFAFEAGASKQGGGQGWADVWKRGFFGWEYKGKHADLEKAYQQLLQYRESLVNPPLLVVCDIDQIRIHTNFTNTVKQVVTLTLDDLLTSAGMRALRAIFYEPEFFRSEQTPEQVTRQAAEEFARLSDHLRKWGESSPRIAHFSIRLLFSLFAEDIEILPRGLFTQMIEQGRRRPDAFTPLLRQLFGTMATGGFFGVQEIRHFDGGLFDSDDVLALDRDGLDILYRVSGLDWSSIEPSIFGTLFQRSLDPSRRAQLGAHYTSKDDILLIVEPVLMAPLRRKWTEVQRQVNDEADKRDAQIAEWQARTDRTQEQKRSQIQGINTRSNGRITGLIQGFLDELRAMRVLDPACGSGNFLYVALRLLLDLEKEVITFAASKGISGLFPQVSPTQLYGIEIDDYAYELAQATVWIGYIQWLHENGFGVPSEPILKPLDNIKHMDAILAYDEQGKPVEPEWPDVDVILGNPPFLGGQRLRRELGDRYLNDLFSLYRGRVAATADLVCYWFEKASKQLQANKLRRAGLLATQAIRAGANRDVLKQIKDRGDIFFAQSDRAWILDGASVRVSMVGFDNGSETIRELDGHSVNVIHADLTSEVDLTQAQQLRENANLCFRADEKGGPFDISKEQAQQMLSAPLNVNGRPNSDVIKPWINGMDIVRRPQEKWIIDFGVNMSQQEAAQYELPFEYVERNVKPTREDNRIDRLREMWWLHRIPGTDMREAISGLSRYIATPRVAKHRIFVFVPEQTLPDTRVAVIARNDDYFFGVLHSRIHEVWSLATSSRHGVGNDPTYNSTTCFETFPFPWPPGKESTDDPRVQAIAAAAKELVELRDRWLNPPDLSEAELKKRTLTNLYNQRPTWLDLAHKKLDRAVFDAYGWPHDLTDEQILERLLALNLERDGKQ